MATLSTTATVAASNGLGPVTHVFAVTTATVTVAAAAALAQHTYGMTVVGISGTASGTEYMACQGANSDGTNALETVSGIALTTTF